MKRILNILFILFWTTPIYAQPYGHGSSGFQLNNNVITLTNPLTKIGIGTSTPGTKEMWIEGEFFASNEIAVGVSGLIQAPIFLGNGSATIQALANGYVRLEPAGTGKSGTTAAFTIDTDGTFTDGDSTFNIQDGSASSMISAGQSTFTTTSARWLKENIKPFASQPPSFRNLQTYSYNYIGSRSRTVGLMSDEWNALMGRPDNGKVNYHEVILVLIAKVKQLETQLDKIKAEN